MSPRRSDAAALAVLSLLAVFFLRRAVVGGEVLFLRDVHMVWYSYVASAMHSVAAGTWPAWDSTFGFGMPFFANPSTMLLYPFTWLNLVLPPHVWYTAFVLFHLIGGGFGAYRLSRRWGLSPLAAITAGAVWSSSGPFLAAADLWHHFAASAWMPWVWLAAERALADPRVRPVLAWAAVIALQILAGSADVVLMTQGAVLLRVVVAYVEGRRLGRVGNRRVFAVAAAAVALGLGLSAAQWIPTVAMGARSARSKLFSERDRTVWSLHPLGVLETVLPFRWSESAADAPKVEAPEDLEESFLRSLYLGLPLPLLAGLWTRGRERAFLSTLLVGGVLLALGRHSWVYEAAVAVVPPLRMVRYPVKVMMLAGLAAALLAGFGVESFRDPERRRPGWTAVTAAGGALVVLLHVAAAVRMPLLAHRFLPAAVAMLVSVGLLVAARRTGRGALGVAVAQAALTLASLVAFHADANPTAPRELLSVRPRTVDLLRAGTPHPRVYVYDYSDERRKRGEGLVSKNFDYVLARHPPGWSAAATFALAFQWYLQPPTAARWGIRGSYDLDLFGTHPEYMAHLTEYLRFTEGTPAHRQLLRLGSVNFALALMPERWWTDLTPVDTVPGLFTEPIRLFQVPDPLPRAYLVDRVRIEPALPEALKAMAAPDFDLRREAIFAETPPPPPPSSAASGNLEATGPGTAALEELRPDLLRIRVEAPRAGYLVDVDAYDPGWEARVDGTAAPVVRANVGFRAVPVASGSHVVELRYRTPGARVGALISLAALALAIVLGLRQDRSGSDDKIASSS
jgi:hypothetical protein